MRAAAFLALALTCSAADSEVRKPWQNTRLAGSPEKAPRMVAVPAYPKLPVKRPVVIEWEPGTDRMLVLENLAWDTYKTTLKAFVDRPEASEMESLLEIPGVEEIAYSLCFHPRYRQNGFLYIGSNGKEPGDKHFSRIVRYTMSREARGRIVERSRLVIIEWSSNGHNGAAACFGKDGMLYVTSGDGTPNSDANNAGQDTASLLSKVLRIDVEGAVAGQTYRVPPDNPFMGRAGVRPETWAYGLRNPWRITCDMESGQIWVGQNGQDLREYGNLLQRGANYGWSEYEGSRPFLTGRRRGPSPFTPPTIEHDHAAFRSLSGGFVYRGKRFPELTGAWLYGDYGAGRVWAAKHDGARLLWNREIADTPAAIAGFGTNAAGDILLADHLGNALLKLEPTPPAPPDRKSFPVLLSETGLFADTAALRPAEGVYRCEINAPAWHDGASSERMLALPRSDAAEFPPASDKAWPWNALIFPDGTALVQTLTLPAAADRPARRMETRVLLKQEADWAGFSWLWNDAQTDATLVPKEGRRVSLSEGEWSVPARTDCVLCHARGANYALGLTTAQLNLEDQLTRFPSLGLLSTKQPDGTFSASIPKPAAELPRLVNPHDPAVALADRVKAYFATNCSHCHRHEGGGNSRMDLSPWVEGAAQHLIAAPPQHGDYGLPGAMLIAPGDPGKSVLPVRLTSRGPGQMPPVGTTKTDPQGTALIFQWLASLPPGPQAPGK